MNVASKIIDFPISESVRLPAATTSMLKALSASPWRTFALLTVLCSAVYAPASGRIGWLCDDHWQVYGQAGQAAPSLAEALRQGGRGTLSPCRMLNLPYVGYLPLLLGAGGCHLLTTASHLTNCLLLVHILRRLHWPEFRARLAAAVFAVSPWIAQATLWWSASPAVVASFLFLLGVALYLRADLGRRSGFVFLSAAALCFFLQLLFYELWLAGMVLLLAVERRRFAESPKKDAAVRVVVALVPFVVFGVWYLSAHEASINQPRWNWSRVPVVFASLHLRTLAWLTHTPWLAGLREGLTSYAAWPSALAAATMISAATAIILSPASREASRRALLADLGLAYSWFLAGRLVLLLRGGVSISTRLNYGSAMAGAMFFALLLDYAARGRSMRRVVAAACVGLIAILGTTTTGISRIYEKSARCEAAAYAALASTIPSAAPNSIFVLIGSPMADHFEDSPYGQLDGFWLHCRLASIRPDVSTYVVPEVRMVESEIRFDAYHRTELRRREIVVPLKDLTAMDWTDENGVPKVVRWTSPTMEVAP